MNEEPQQFGNERGPGKRKEPEKDRGPVIQKEGRYFICETKIDEATGDIVWEASKMDDPHRITLRVPQNHPFRSLLLEKLRSSEFDIAEIRVIQRQGDKDWQVMGVEPPLPDEARQVKDEKGLKYMWTPSLDAAVDKYFEYGMLKSAMEYQADMLCKHDAYEDVVNGTMGDGDSIQHPGARAIFLATVARTRKDIPQTEAAEFFERHLKPDAECSKASYVDLLKGEEKGRNGQIRRVFYDAAREPEEQIADLAAQPRSSAMSSLLNYAMQDAATRNLSDQLRRPVEDGAVTFATPIQKMQADLRAHGALEGEHPARDSHHYQNLNAEFAEMEAGRSLRALMASAGACSATLKYDDVIPNDRSPRDRDGRLWTYADALRRFVEGKDGPTPQQARTMTTEQLREALLQVAKSSGELHESFQAGITERVDHEMTMAMGKDRDRTGTFDAEAHEKRMKIKKEAGMTIIKSAAKEIDGITGGSYF